MTKEQKRIYPRDVWVLTPSFKPKKVTVVRGYEHSSAFEGDYDAGGKYYSVGELYSTPGTAVAAGRAKVEEMEVRMRKLGQSIEKRRAALDKFEASLGAAA